MDVDSKPSPRVDPEAEAIFKNYLREGEQIYWTGRPKTGWVVRKVDRLLIPFSLVWLAAVGFWEYLAQFSSRPGLYSLLGVPFLLLGLWMAVGRFMADARRRRHTYYALTNQRLLIEDRRKNEGMLRLPLPRPHQIMEIEHAGGYHTLYLPPPADPKEKRRMKRYGLMASLDFIQNAEAVKKLIAQMNKA